MVPLHTAWFGVQTCALHVAVTLSQYSELAHVADTVELTPSAAQCCSVDPEQKYVLGEHASGTHAPW
jgi:hypothetical protein